MGLGNSNSVEQLRRHTVLILSVMLSFQPTAHAEPTVVINEIMYHVRATEHKEDLGAEYIELHNVTDSAIDLTGWQFDSGLRFSFSDQTIKSGGFLVVAADLQAFKEDYPDVERVVGPFRGRLSNSGETLTLIDSDKHTVDSVSYADSGFWARKVSGKLKGYDDWTWHAPHDGEGHSLELIKPSFQNDHGLAWSPSKETGGTPGQPNSVRSELLAPLVTSVRHEPAIPKSLDKVRVIARVQDDSGTGLKASVRYRHDGQVSFKSAPMTLASNGDWVGTLPASNNLTVVQFFVRFEDGEGAVRQYPQLAQTQTLQSRLPLRPSTGSADRQAVCLYQVDDTFDIKAARTPGAKPVYRLIAPREEMEMIRDLVNMSGRGNAYNNHMHATFISVDGRNTQLRYQVSARIRGHGSRSNFPPGLRVSFPSDAPWKGVTDINLNSQQTQSQALGAALHQLAGFAAARSTPIHLRMNGKDWTSKALPQYGCYVHNEVLDSRYLEEHFPGESDGNMYRLVGSANLNNRGTNLSNYRTLYNKRNNGSEDDYSDIITLVKTLDQRNPGAEYLDQVGQIVDIKQWARYMAMDALLCNHEGGMADGRGDDVAIMRCKDGRFHLIPYDLDSILGMGEGSSGYTQSIYQYGNMQGLRGLFQNREFLRLYADQFRDLTDTFYRPEILNRVVDDVLGGWVPDKKINEIKAFIPKRIDFIMSQFRSHTVVGSTIGKVKGIHKATSEQFALYGSFNMGQVDSITVGGIVPTIFKQTGTWILPPKRIAEVVNPGFNQIPVIMRDHAGDVVDQETLRVWLDTGSVKEISGTLAAGGHQWSSGEGPYLLKSTVTLPEGASMVIGPGTTVYAEADARLVIKGNLAINGRPNQRVIITADPRDEANPHWLGVQIAGGNTAIQHTDLLGIKDSLIASDANLALDHVTLTAVDDGKVLFDRAVVNIVDSTFERKSASSKGLIFVKHGDVQFEHCEIQRQPTAGPAVVNNSKKTKLIGNRFVGGSAPAIVLDSPGHLDGNDFLTTESESPLVITKGPGSLIIRNRVQNNQQLVESQLPDRGNEVVTGKLSKRRFQSTHARFLRQPSSGTSPSVTIQPDQLGLKAYRHRIDDGPWSDALEAKDHATRLVTVQPGIHRIALLGQNLLGEWQPEDQATVSEPFEINPDLTTIRLSEILAINHTSKTFNGDHVDWIELENFGSNEVDISGYTLSDDPDNPHKFIFPAGSAISGHDFAAPKELGFGLAGTGEYVSLYSAKGKLLDSLRFGLQIPDHSVGRVDDTWHLCTPTIGQSNKAVKLGKSSDLRLTEWLSTGTVSSPNEFIEIQNWGTFPVAIAGMTITDNVPHRRSWQPITALSFLDAQQVQAFITDGKPDKGADHLDFRLANEGEVIALLDSQGRPIDFAAFGPQIPGTSAGHNEFGQIVYQERPSPGKVASAAVNDSDRLQITSIRISEVHFNPEEEENEEFLELTNIGQAVVALEGLSFTQGIDWTSEPMDLAPNESIVIVKDRKAFRRRYDRGIRLAGEFEGKLSNGGERLQLITASGAVVCDFEYSDKWHTATDGKGKSLELVDARASQIERKKAWRASAKNGGSPGVTQS